MRCLNISPNMQNILPGLNSCQHVSIKKLSDQSKFSWENYNLLRFKITRLFSSLSFQMLNSGLYMWPQLGSLYMEGTHEISKDRWVREILSECWPNDVGVHSLWWKWTWKKLSFWIVSEGRALLGTRLPFYHENSPLNLNFKKITFRNLS